MRCNACRSEVDVPTKNTGESIKCPVCDALLSVPTKKVKKKRVTIKAQCDLCEVIFKVDQSRIGTTGKCPKCKGKTYIDEVTQGDLEFVATEKAKDKARRAIDPSEYYGAAFKGFWYLKDAITPVLSFIIAIAVMTFGLRVGGGLVLTFVPSAIDYIGILAWGVLGLTLLASSYFMMRIASSMFTITMDNAVANQEAVTLAENNYTYRDLIAFGVWAVVYFGPALFCGFQTEGGAFIEWNIPAMVALAVMGAAAPMAFLMVAMGNRYEALNFPRVIGSIIETISTYVVLLGLIGVTFFSVIFFGSTLELLAVAKVIGLFPHQPIFAEAAILAVTTAIRILLFFFSIDLMAKFIGDFAYYNQNQLSFVHVYNKTKAERPSLFITIVGPTISIIFLVVLFATFKEQAVTGILPKFYQAKEIAIAKTKSAHRAGVARMQPAARDVQIALRLTETSSDADDYVTGSGKRSVADIVANRKVKKKKEVTPVTTTNTEKSKTRSFIDIARNKKLELEAASQGADVLNE